MIRTVLVFCVLGIASCTLCSCKGKSTFTTRVGEHSVVIIQMTPLLNTGTSHGSREGAKLTYEYLDLKVKLEDEVLTVNGRRYIIPEKDDSIKIINDRAGIKVEINGQPAKAEDNGGRNNGE